MSKRKKKRESGAPMPAASAGLLRFFEEETKGIQIKPELVVVLSVSLIIICLLAQIYYSGGLF
jgi:preprotein translocase subunit Sec61beta